MLVLPVNAFQILNGLNTADCVRQSVRGMILKERVVLKRKIVYRNDWRFEIISGSRHKIKTSAQIFETSVTGARFSKVPGTKRA